MKYRYNQIYGTRYYLIKEKKETGLDPIYEARLLWRIDDKGRLIVYDRDEQINFHEYLVMQNIEDSQAYRTLFEDIMLNKREILFNQEIHDDVH